MRRFENISLIIIDEICKEKKKRTLENLIQFDLEIINENGRILDN